MTDKNKFALLYCTDGVQFNILPPIIAASDEVEIDDIKNRMAHVKTLPGEPLFAVTGIPVNDGIFGGVSCSHTIADGISLMLFLYAWGCALQGKSYPLPSTQRLFRGNPVCFDKMDKSFIPPLSELNEKIQKRVHAINAKRYFKREYFPDAFLNETKKKAKEENKKYIISNNQIITSFLLKKYHHLMMPDADKIKIKIPVDFRGIHPDIDPLYIGNVVFDSFTEFYKNEIDAMSIYQIAYRLKESVKQTRNKNHMKEIAYVTPHGIEFNPEIFKHYPSYNVDTCSSAERIFCRFFL